MTARREDLYARRNATFACEFTFADATGSPIDFTGADVVMEIRLHGAAPGDALIRLEPVGAADQQGLAPALGSITARIDEVDLWFLPRARSNASALFTWDLVGPLIGGGPSILRRGVLELAPGVTSRLTLRTTEAGDYRVTEDGAYRTTE